MSKLKTSPVKLKKSMDRRKFLIGAGVFVLIALSLVVARIFFTPVNKYAAIDITGANYGKDFQLTDHNGKPTRLEDFKGKVVVLFFGYTQCPDVCPTAMLEMAQVKKELGRDADKLQVVFATVDPERDTQEVLKAYMENFDPTFLALRGTPEQLSQIAADFRIIYNKVNGSTPTSYTMDHSAGRYIYDANGHLRLYARYGIEAPVIASDIRLLLKDTNS